MTVTAVENVPAVAPPDVNEQRATYNQRVHGLHVGDQVRVLSVGHSSDRQWLGRTGELLRIDASDSLLTFLLRLDDGGETWAHDVAPMSQVGQHEPIVEIPDVESVRAENRRLLEEVTQANQQMTLARRQVTEAQRRWERLWDALNEQAEEKDWCAEYDDFAEEWGMPRRTTTLSGTVRITYVATYDAEIEIEGNRGQDFDEAFSDWEDFDADEELTSAGVNYVEVTDFEVQ